jgi:hypothetical protein
MPRLAQLLQTNLNDLPDFTYYAGHGDFAAVLSVLKLTSLTRTCQAIHSGCRMAFAHGVLTPNNFEYRVARLR